VVQRSLTWEVIQVIRVGDPITLAAGHSIINGKDIGDYAYGTKFYVPNLRKYFTAADACGDGKRLLRHRVQAVRRHGS
jgi:hypothetical protein